MPSAKRGYFIWRNMVRQRQSTDWEIVDHPLVREAFGEGVRHGEKRMLHSSAEWAQLAPLLGSVLEELIGLRELVEIAGDEDDE